MTADQGITQATTAELKANSGVVSPPMIQADEPKLNNVATGASTLQHKNTGPQVPSLRETNGTSQRDPITDAPLPQVSAQVLRAPIVQAADTGPPQNDAGGQVLTPAVPVTPQRVEGIPVGEARDTIPPGGTATTDKKERGVPGAQRGEVQGEQEQSAAVAHPETQQQPDTEHVLMSRGDVAQTSGSIPEQQWDTSRAAANPVTATDQPAGDAPASDAQRVRVQEDTPPPAQANSGAGRGSSDRGGNDKQTGGGPGRPDDPTPGQPDPDRPVASRRLDHAGDAHSVPDVPAVQEQKIPVDKIKYVQQFDRPKDRTPTVIWRGEEIVPWAFTNDMVQERIQQVNSPEDIDAFVDLMRNQFFPYWLQQDGTPPLLLVQQNPSKDLLQGMRRKLVTPENFASTLWNYDFRHYPGTVQNVRAALTAYNPQYALTPKDLIFVPTVVPFSVEGDLRSETGKYEGTVTKEYVLFSKRFGFGSNLPGNMVDVARNFYSDKELRTRKSVQMSSFLPDAPSVRHLIHVASERVFQSKQRADAAERETILHPWQGGLPGLGKHSR